MTVTADLPDPRKLTLHQIKGHACARCGYRLYQPVRIGVIPDGHGVHAGTVVLYVCPCCVAPEERETQT